MVKTTKAELRRRGADARKRARSALRGIERALDRIRILQTLVARRGEEVQALRAISAACRAHPVTGTLRALLEEMDRRTSSPWPLNDDQRLVAALMMLPTERASLRGLPKALNIPAEQVLARVEALIAVFGGDQ